MKDDLNKLWDFDSLGIREKDFVQERLEQNMRTLTLKMVDTLHGNLSWREHHELLPRNYENCVVKLNSTVKQVEKQAEVFREFRSRSKWYY